MNHNLGITFRVEVLRQVGRDAECLAFVQALQWPCEHHVIVIGNKAMGFRE